MGILVSVQVLDHAIPAAVGLIRHTARDGRLFSTPLRSAVQLSTKVGDGGHAVKYWFECRSSRICGCMYRAISVVLAVTEKDKIANSMDIAVWLQVVAVRKGIGSTRLTICM
jgi:hypothetical protein